MGLKRREPDQGPKVLPSFDPYVVQKFWSEWDSIAARRKVLLDCANVDWLGVKNMIIESNLLLTQAPDRTLKRLARLCKLPLDFDPDTDGGFIYVIFGKILPYVVQTGCLGNTRSVMERYKEHLSRAKALYKHLTALRYLIRTSPPLAFQKTPGIARLMARDGLSSTSVLTVNKVPANIVGGCMERRWVRMLGLTSNQRLPFGGIDKMTWENILNKPLPTTRGTHSVLWKIINSNSESFCPDEGLMLALAVLSTADKRVFDKFFTILRRVVKKKNGPSPYSAG